MRLPQRGHGAACRMTNTHVRSSSSLVTNVSERSSDIDPEAVTKRSAGSVYGKTVRKVPTVIGR
eukprot:m.12024 g.12024  ORF g.12024 m.12024 type:complete len:64 (-) comp6042_c0_seq1:112-303(-)